MDARVSHNMNIAQEGGEAGAGTFCGVISMCVRWRRRRLLVDPLDRGEADPKLAGKRRLELAHFGEGTHWLNYALALVREARKESNRVEL